MKRRTLLAALAASTGTVGAAGCLQTPGSPGETTTTDDGADTATDGTDTATAGSETTEDGATTQDPGDWNPSGEPVATLQINDREGLSFPDNNRPHSLALRNEVDREREVRVEWSDGLTEELEFLDPVAVPADGLLQVDLQLPTSYDVVLKADGESLGTSAVGREHFDCNSSASRLGLGEGELTDYGVISTAAGCPPPSVADTSLSATEGDCGNEDDEAAIAGYGDEVVHVEGTFAAPTPCHELAVADVAYDGTTGTATVVVEASRGDGGCVECVGTIDYEATVTYEADFPDHVVVVHRSGADDDEREVATAAWNADV